MARATRSGKRYRTPSPETGQAPATKRAKTTSRKRKSTAKSKRTDKSKTKGDVDDDAEMGDSVYGDDDKTNAPDDDGDETLDVSEHSEDPEPVKSRPEKKQQRGSRKAAHKLLQVEDPAQKQSNQAFDDYCEESLKYHDPTLKNTACVLKALQFCRLAKVVSPRQEAIQDEKRLLDKLKLEPFEERRFTWKIHKHSNHSRWAMRITNVGKSKLWTHPTTKEIIIPFKEVASDKKEDVDKLVKAVIDIFLAWPWQTLSRGNNMNKVVIELAKQQAGLSEHTYILDCAPKHRGYNIRFLYIDPATGEQRTRRIDLNPVDSVMANVQVPGLPSLVVQRGQSGDTKPLAEQNPVYLPAPPDLKCSPESQHKAQDVLRFIASQCTGLVVNENRLDEIIEFHQASLGLTSGGRRKTKVGPYDGDDLTVLTTHVLDRKISIKPSKSVLRDMGFSDAQGSNLGLRVNSLDACRMMQVLDTVYQLFIGGMDIRKVWIEAAMIADQVNMEITEGIPASSVCDCDDKQTAVIPGDDAGLVYFPTFFLGSWLGFTID